MSFLKKKITRAIELRKRAKQGRIVFNQTPFQPQAQNVQLQDRDFPQKEGLKVQLSNKPSHNGLSSAKKIIKSYSTATIRFALSDLAGQFLQPLLQRYGLNVTAFRDFINLRKPQANSIKGLRRMLSAEEKDCEQTLRMKETFKDISIIFIKRFSVNWIYSSKITDKRTYLNYRFKILRRLNGLHFIYLKEFSNGTNKKL